MSSYFILDPDLRKRLAGRDQFDQLMAMEGRIYKNLPGRKTLRFSAQDKSYFIKIHRGVGWKEIFKNILQLRLPVLGAKNEWVALQRLEHLGIKTMKAAGFGSKGCNPARRQSFIITEDLGESISLAEFCRNWKNTPPDPALKRQLIKEIASLAKRMHDNGINHRDFYLCHLRFKTDDPPTPAHAAIHVMDLHRAQLRGHTPQRWAIKDIAGLYFSSMDTGLSRTDLLRFIKTYRAQSLRDILATNQSFWRKVGQRAFHLYRNAAPQRGEPEKN